jgi:hypothetical protein
MDFRDRFAGWLTGQGAEADSIAPLIHAFCTFLNDANFAIHRCSLATETVHPQMTGMRHVWYRQAVEIAPVNAAVLVDRRQYRVGDALIDEIFFNSQSQPVLPDRTSRRTLRGNWATRIAATLSAVR